MINLNSDIDISRFFSWWGQELSFLLPEKIRESISSGRGLLVVEVNIEKTKVSYVNSDQKTVLGEYVRNALAKQELKEKIENNPQYKDADIVLRIPESISIKKDLFLPAATEKNIQKVLLYEIDKYTPFNKDQVYFDTIKFEKEKNTNQIHLLLVLVKKVTLDRMYESCVSLGLTPHYSDSAAQPVIPNDVSSQYNLLPDDLCQKNNKLPFYTMLGSMLLALILFFVMLFYPLYKLDNGLDKLKHHKRLAEKEAFEIERSKKRVDYLYLATQKVIDKQNELPAMIDVINSATKAFKDDTWVSQFRYVNKSLQLTGQSSSASGLIESLEETSIFHNAKFISPVTKDNRTGMERFKISTEVAKKQSNAEAK